MAERQENDSFPSQGHGAGTGHGSEEGGALQPLVMKDHPCFGCIHFYGRFYINFCCNYIFDVGRSRPCPPGAKCTVKDADPVRDRAKRQKRKKMELR